jgi:hydroxyethylthiazole kinase
MEKDVLQAVTRAVEDTRSKAPLVGSWTNFVTINLVANTQLAVGARAAMCFLPDEAYPLSTISQSVYINVGTMNSVSKEALTLAAKSSSELGKPWVLDPVAAGLGESRNALIADLKQYKPPVIRGNASEIIILATMWGLQSEITGEVSGVDSTDSVESAHDSAKVLARWTGGAVCVSGAVDFITDGKTSYQISGGSALLKKITGAGCSLAGVIAAYVAVASPLIAAVTGSLAYKYASEEAAKTAKGSFSFQTAFIDCLSLLDETVVADGFFRKPRDIL